MKSKTIWIIVGVVILILIIANWNKIFGAEKKRVGGNANRVGARPGSIQRRLKLSNIYGKQVYPDACEAWIYCDGVIDPSGCQRLWRDCEKALSKT